MKSLSCVAMLCLYLCPLYGQVDSLVVFKDLTFQSEFERQTFNGVLQHRVDPFYLMMAAGGVLTDSKIKESHDQFYEFVTAIGRESAGKKNEKRIKYLHDQISDKYFKKYEGRCQFEALFYNGYYNSASASALYALVFDKLGIPYALKEDQTQVYLIAYPEGERIMLRSVPKLGGYFVLSDQFKDSYISQLRDQKIIEPSEYENSDLQHLFDKYFFGLGELSLMQLAAVQYANEGTQVLNEGKYKEAFVLFEKAYILYPSPRTAYFLYTGIVQEFLVVNRFDDYQAVLLSKLARYKDWGTDEGKVEYELMRAGQKLLSEGAQFSAFEHYYQVLDSAVRDAGLKDRLAFRYQYEYGRYYYNRGMLDEAMPYMERALTLKPADGDTQSLFLALLSQRLAIQTENGKLLADIERYGQTYPSLQTNNNYNAMLAMSYLIRSYVSFAQKKVADGDAYRGRFETLMDKYPGLKVYADFVSEAYSSAAVYYFRQGKTARARDLVNKGLKYAPDNYELTARKEMMK